MYVFVSSSTQDARPKMHSPRYLQRYFIQTVRRCHRRLLEQPRRSQRQVAGGVADTSKHLSAAALPLPLLRRLFALVFLLALQVVQPKEEHGHSAWWVFVFFFWDDLGVVMMRWTDGRERFWWGECDELAMDCGWRLRNCDLGFRFRFVVAWRSGAAINCNGRAVVSIGRKGGQSVSDEWIALNWFVIVKMRSGSDSIVCFLFCLGGNRISFNLVSHRQRTV